MAERLARSRTVERAPIAEETIGFAARSGACLAGARPLRSVFETIPVVAKGSRLPCSTWSRARPQQDYRPFPDERHQVGAESDALSPEAYSAGAAPSCPHESSRGHSQPEKKNELENINHYGWTTSTVTTQISPAPKWHEEDGSGRYLGYRSTYSITRCPGIKISANAFAYRPQFARQKDGRPSSHGRRGLTSAIHRDVLQARRAPLPVALVIAAIPLSVFFFLGGLEAPLRRSFSSSDLVGGRAAGGR